MTPDFLTDFFLDPRFFARHFFWTPEFLTDFFFLTPYFFGRHRAASVRRLDRGALANMAFENGGRRRTPRESSRRRKPKQTKAKDEPCDHRAPIFATFFALPRSNFFKRDFRSQRFCMPSLGPIEAMGAPTSYKMPRPTSRSLPCEKASASSASHSAPMLIHH